MPDARELKLGRRESAAKWQKPDGSWDAGPLAIAILGWKRRYWPLRGLRSDITMAGSMRDIGSAASSARLAGWMKLKTSTVTELEELRRRREQADRGNHTGSKGRIRPVTFVRSTKMFVTARDDTSIGGMSPYELPARSGERPGAASPAVAAPEGGST